jgi:hypothetical protein
MGDRAVVWWEDMDLPFARGLMNKNNELHSQEHWYRVPKEAQPPEEELLKDETINYNEG